MAIIDITLKVYIVDQADEIKITNTTYTYLHVRNAALSLCLDHDLVYEDMEMNIKVREEGK